jgi:hypothetical protein
MGKESMEEKKTEKNYALDSVKFVLDTRVERGIETWEQPAELNRIADHWHDFDEDTKRLILTAIPEAAQWILRKKISELAKEE